MFCTKCGASVVGKYCSCCGNRVRSSLEDLRLAEKRAKREFENACGNSEYPRRQLELLHLANACWLASYQRYNKSARYMIGDIIPPEAYDSLETVRIHAQKLFDQLAGI